MPAARQEATIVSRGKKKGAERLGEERKEGKRRGAQMSFLTYSSPLLSLSLCPLYKANKQE
jgi:hypothetical protein